MARLPLTKQKGLLSDHKIEKYFDNVNELQLNHLLFKDRVIILEELKSKTVSIKSKHSTMHVKIGITDFPFLGIWSAPKPSATFICVEPWYGLSDSYDTSGDFKSKKGIQSLEPRKSFLMKYFIEIAH